ncbi:MAG: hypothetical protein JSW39_05505 [Desulfobacterales bacterium]|nr:MAG: hypothetical protein JSW39_05505 [Desulfobacterales bacterium]
MDQRWTILFVDGQGRVTPYKRLKRLLAIGLLIVVTTISAAIGFLILNQKSLGEKQKLQKKLNAALGEIESLRHEKDLLLARLVLTEVRLKEGKVRTEENPAEKQSIRRPPNESSEVSAQTSDDPPEARAAPLIESDTAAPSDVRKTPSQTQPTAAQEQLAATPVDPAPEAAEEPSTTNSRVAIEDFQLTHEPDTQTFKAQLTLKNTTSNSQRVTGKILVVLKNDELQPQEWLTLPPATLVASRPSEKTPGQAFSIRNFKRMKLKRTSPASTDLYDQAAVFVIAENGDLLLEQTFPADF